MWIENSNPIAHKADTVHEPPYESSGNGIPVQGITPITIPILIMP